MRALVVKDIGGSPELAEVARPTRGAGEALISVECAALNPADIAVSNGRFFAGHPPTPYVPGIEVVGEIVESDEHASGTLVFGCLKGMGVARDGSLAEYVVADDDQLVQLPPGTDPLVSISAGTASLAGWIPLTWRAPVREDDTVLILGATGSVGQVAVQTARINARTVVAVGRDPERLAETLALGADATIRLDPSIDLAEAIRERVPDGVTLVFDSLWGEPLVGALKAAAYGARIVQLGQSASPDATIPSALVRGKDLDLLGYTNVNVPFEVLSESHLALVDRIAKGEITVKVSSFGLEDGVRAWQEQVAGPASKIVVCP